MTRHAIGEILASRLFAAETAIDAALSETASLAALLPAARAEACLSAVTGQKAFDGTAASILALAQARSHLVETHLTLAALARRLGIETVDVGGLDKPEDRPPVGEKITRAFPRKVNERLPNSRETC